MNASDKAQDAMDRLFGVRESRPGKRPEQNSRRHTGLMRTSGWQGTGGMKNGNRAIFRWT